MQDQKLTEHRKPVQGLEQDNNILKEAAHQVKITGTNLASKAGQTAKETKQEAQKHLTSQKEEVVRQIGGVNEALRQTAENVDNPNLGAQMNKLADQVEKAADRLEQAELEDVVTAVEDLSRTQPLLFLSGSFLTGLMLARFLRATTPEPQHLSHQAISSPNFKTREVAPNDHLVGR